MDERHVFNLSSWNCLNQITCFLVVRINESFERQGYRVFDSSNLVWHIGRHEACLTRFHLVGLIANHRLESPFQDIEDLLLWVLVHLGTFTFFVTNSCQLHDIAPQYLTAARRVVSCNEIVSISAIELN